MHFTITGEYLTEQARTWWALEGEHDRAVRLLATAFPAMPEGDRMAVILGKKKIVGENSECFLEDDNATHHHGEKILSLEEVLAQQKAKQKLDAQQIRLLNQIRRGDVTGCASRWGLIMVPNELVKRTRIANCPYCTMEWDEFAERFPMQVTEAEERAEQWREANEHKRTMKRYKKGETVEQIFGTPEQFVEKATADLLGVQSLVNSMPEHLQAAAKAVLAPPLKEPPKVDRDMASKNGWLSPDGKFYPCGFMEHVRVAHTLHDQGESGLEKAWVKIQDSYEPNAVIERYKAPGSDFAHIPRRGVTQAQLNAMQRWCDRHGRQLPPNLETR